MPNLTSGHSRDERGFATRAIRVGQDPCSATGATVVPVYQTATFTLPAVGVTKGFDYSRSGNPTRDALELQLADLEGARFGSAFGSGMAAVAGIAALLSSGDHILATRDIYGGTHRLFTAILPRYGITTTFVDFSDPNAVAAAVKPNTKLFWVETPSNPILKLTDIAGIAALKRSGQIVAVDNTFSSPFFQQPLRLGADVVMHSTTKYLSGHSDVVGGIVITDDEELHRQIRFHQNAVGAVPGPWDAYLTLRGAKTLALRMQAHARNALAIAQFLGTRDDVDAVYYPGLAAHPQHELARRQMSGFGGVVSFRVAGGAQRAAAVARSTRLFNLAVSLGGVESLICIPAKMTHGSLADSERLELGITGDLLRLSVGIEDAGDLQADLGEALDRSRGEEAIPELAIA
ncbi:MAG: trans-sulfuration enzyme family protein [Vulcanimicrobiaceae bacterium]